MKLSDIQCRKQTSKTFKIIWKD